MRVIGIDPGITGALVLLEDGMPIEWIHMPTVKSAKSSRVNSVVLAEFLRQECDLVIVEQVHAMPKQGVSSMFSFGHAAGTIAGVVGALQKPYYYVTPQSWKKDAGLIGKDKDAARTLAIQKQPKWRDLDKKIKGQALADAALIALYRYS